jgi:hypothetical protein
MFKIKREFMTVCLALLTKLCVGALVMSRLVLAGKDALRCQMRYISYIASFNGS